MIRKILGNNEGSPRGIEQGIGRSGNL